MDQQKDKQFIRTIHQITISLICLSREQGNTMQDVKTIYHHGRLHIRFSLGILDFNGCLKQSIKHNIYLGYLY